MGAKCVRAVEPTFDESPKWKKDGGFSPGGFEEAEVDKFLRDGHDQSALEAMLERWTLGTGVQEQAPHARPVGHRLGLRSPVMLHAYDYPVQFSPASSSTEKIHVGIEVHGREWSFSSFASCPGDPTGVFVSAPRACLGWNYDQSVDMGATMASQDSVLRIISLMKKEWTASSFSTDRNSFHFCQDLCRSLGVGMIPERVARRAAGKKDECDCQTVAPLLCCSDKKFEPQVMEQIAVVPPNISRKQRHY